MKFLSLIYCLWNKDDFFLMYFFLYKALNGYMNIDMSRYVQFYSDTARYPLRGKDSLTLKKNYARTNTFKFSFLNHIVDMWNSLPFYVRSASSISSFKHGVTKILSGLSEYGVFDSFTDYPYGIFRIFFPLFVFCKLPLNCNK